MLVCTAYGTDSAAAACYRTSWRSLLEETRKSALSPSYPATHPSAISVARKRQSTALHDLREWLFGDGEEKGVTCGWMSQQILR